MRTDMQIADLALFLARDLATLRDEVLAYPDDESPWALPAGVPNSGGTLVLHLCGNLRHFVGAGIGDSGYVRDRTAEFATRDVSREALAALVDETARDVARALRDASAEQLDRRLSFGGVEVPARRALLHLAVHLTYHLGQLDYHRRIVTGDGRGVGAMGLATLGG